MEGNMKRLMILGALALACGDGDDNLTSGSDAAEPVGPTDTEDGGGNNQTPTQGDGGEGGAPPEVGAPDASAPEPDDVDAAEPQSDPVDSGLPPVEANICSPEDRSGTYLVHYEERSDGTCGPIPDSLGRVHPDDELTEGCIFTADDVWRDDDCTLERSIECNIDGVKTTVAGLTTQQDPEGEAFEGIVSFVITDGVTTCVSIYDVTYTRQ